MSDYCAFICNHQCIKWMDYGSARQKIEEGGGMGTGLKSSVCGTTLMLQKSLFEENDITPPEEEDLR